MEKGLGRETGIRTHTAPLVTDFSGNIHKCLEIGAAQFPIAH
jgi:hypothetical protein